MSIGQLTWDDCQDCIYTDPIIGGCKLGVPEDINKMKIVFDFIICTKYEKVK